MPTSSRISRKCFLTRGKNRGTCCDAGSHSLRRQPTAPCVTSAPREQGQTWGPPTHGPRVKDRRPGAARERPPGLRQQRETGRLLRGVVHAGVGPLVALNPVTPDAQAGLPLAVLHERRRQALLLEARGHAGAGLHVGVVHDFVREVRLAGLLVDAGARHLGAVRADEPLQRGVLLLALLGGARAREAVQGLVVLRRGGVLGWEDV